MFINKITIKNFRLFPSANVFEINDINTPDGTNEGSGLNVFVGENGSGKTALLDAFALPILEYKTDNFGIENFHDTKKNVEINIFAKDPFEVAGTMPKATFLAKGFSFEAHVRKKDTSSYLSSIVVNDQKFIKVDPDKPKDNSPDLRVNVNNPFMGKRFSENDILFLDRNRTYQTRTGNFNTTRFDRLMEDLSRQYLKRKEESVANLNKTLGVEVGEGEVENEFLAQALKKFFEFSGKKLSLDYIDNHEPFKRAFFAVTKENNQQILLNNLGSGYEMIFSLIYSFYLAKQSGKQLIVLIDEPELHLHPVLQEKFVAFLLDSSKTAQIILASHSPLLVKQLSANEKAKIRILKREALQMTELDKRVLPYISANETNWLAFGLATEEYHNELYEVLKSIHGDGKEQLKFDGEFFVRKMGERKNSPHKGDPDKVSIHTFIRNQIHHQRDNGKPTYESLKSSIQKMQTFPFVAQDENNNAP